ncbi:hypothetical protein G7085_02335 [Tessaracoccus sp. HDW20]|nr:hypothetical protein [Tessaracoccus coleopterorum]
MQDRGIDGFRLDVINYISKPDGLPDGNPFVGGLMGFVGVEHYFYGPRLGEFLRGLRRDGFTRRAAPPRPRASGWPTARSAIPAPDPVGVMVGETPGIGIQLGRMLSGGGRDQLDLIFNFDILDTPGHTRWDDYRFDPEYLKRFYRAYTGELGPNDWIAVFLDNHDNPRMLSKLADGAESDPAVRTAVGKLLATLQLTMRGTPFLFQGRNWRRSTSPSGAWTTCATWSRSTGTPSCWARPWGRPRRGARSWPGPATTHGCRCAGRRRAASPPAPPGCRVTMMPRVLRRGAGGRPRLGVLVAPRPHRAAPPPPCPDPGRPGLGQARGEGYLAYTRSLGDERFLIECNVTPEPLRRPGTGSTPPRCWAGTRTR